MPDAEAQPSVAWRVGPHAFNGGWLRSRVGVSDDVRLLLAPGDEVAALDDRYDVVEVRVDLAALPPGWLGADNGFVQVDTQLAYTASLAAAPAPPPDVVVRSARDEPLGALDDLAPFSAERYRRLPGVDDTLLAQRYRTWALDTAARHPDWCGAVWKGDDLAGYVFAEPDRRGAHFALAASARASRVPGLALYLGAPVLFRASGARRMHAAFSASNVAAVNAHIVLRCRVERATGVWFRVRPGWRATSCP